MLRAALHAAEQGRGLPLTALGGGHAVLIPAPAASRPICATMPVPGKAVLHCVGTPGATVTAEAVASSASSMRDAREAFIVWEAGCGEDLWRGFVEWRVVVNVRVKW